MEGELCRICTGYYSRKKDFQKDPVSKRELVDRIENYLYEHYQEEDLSLNRIALELQFESSYLRRVYKTQKGVTISQKLQSIRIDRAKELLDSGVFWNKEICELVGYSDQYYFSKRFKQICGCTPTEYRKSRL